MQIAVVDYGMGNLHSVKSALQHVSTADVLVTNDQQVILDADRVVFPGVGAMGYCMQQLHDSGLVSALSQAVQEKPMLAICVGMQALFDLSEESNGTDCLGWLPGRVEHFNSFVDVNQQQLRVPHMGWSPVGQSNEHAIWHNIDDDERFYFVHSYAVPKQYGSGTAIGETIYGASFVSAVAHGNLVATQFHPEKSHSAGLQLIKNFTEL